MADREDGDRLPRRIDLIDHDVASDHEPSQARIDLFRKTPAEKGLLCQSLDTVEKILHDSPRGGRILFSDEVEEFVSPFQRGIGPENAVGHYS